MKSFQQSVRISISLVTLTLFVALMANWLGYIPDESKARLRERVNIAESLAVTCTAAIKNNKLEVIHDVIKQYVERHQQIQSVLVGAVDGKILVKQGEHPPLSNGMESTPDLVKVPIYMDSKLWGVLQVGFTPFHSDYLWGVVEPSFFRLIVFISVFGFILYVLLIKKVLSHLDPYKVVPARVKKAFNALSEAVVLINNEERIVLANKVFEEKFHFDTEKRLGEKLSSLSWQFPAEYAEAKQILPWRKTLSDGGDHTNVRLDYQPIKGRKLSLVANCTALTDEKGSSKGVLASFSDVTELEKMNQDLENMSRFMRHEIYNELVGASGGVKLLASSDRLTEDEKQLLRLTQKSHSVIHGRMELDQRRFPQALALLEKAKDAYREDASVVVLHALARLGAGDAAGADEVERLMTANPKLRFGEPWLDAATILIARKDAVRAKAMLERFLGQQPSNVKALHLLGRALRATGDAAGGSAAQKKAWHEYSTTPPFKRREFRVWAYRANPLRPALYGIAVLGALVAVGLLASP